MLTPKKIGGKNWRLLLNHAGLVTYWVSLPAPILSTFSMVLPSGKYVSIWTEFLLLAVKNFSGCYDSFISLTVYWYLSLFLPSNSNSNGSIFSGLKCSVVFSPGCNLTYLLSFFWAILHFFVNFLSSFQSILLSILCIHLPSLHWQIGVTQPRRRHFVLVRCTVWFPLTL